MAGFTAADKALFPLRSIGSVVELFKRQLEHGQQQPDLALLSIVAGAIENSLTCPATVQKRMQLDQCDQTGLPVLQLHVVEELYCKFRAIMFGAMPANNKGEKGGAKVYATREIVKKVSDIVWNSLTRSYYRDRPHLQSLYSYLTGSKLDCFGVAFAVVAGCQMLGYTDVHLALSEDHAWVVFGESQTDTAEVTWHGKGNEDKRGMEINRGVVSRSWLYVNNKPVVCTRAMEVAALVSAINPSLNATHDACELAMLQQELLWLLYDLGHLARYPMAIGNLGDLEEIAKTPGRMPCKSLFQEAILSARMYYNNHHVYPYTYQGGYFYRNKMYKEAFESWANASDVIRLYNYSRDDEEIYKEFLEIANELIPYVMKVESSGFSANTMLKKPECFANLLRFYDGICQWEEGSATPVLHIGWAKPLVNTISKFDADVRAQVNIVCEQPNQQGDNRKDNHHRANGDSDMSVSSNNRSSTLRATTTNGSQTNNNYCDSATTSSASVKKENGSKVTEDVNGGGNMHPSLEALTAGCSEKILNPEFLLQGGGNPFVGPEDPSPNSPSTKSDKSTSDTPPSTSIPNLNPPQSTPTADTTSTTTPTLGEIATDESTETKPLLSDIKSLKSDERSLSPPPPQENTSPTVILHSRKMQELKDLLLAEKLNTHAISLHLTALSQVQVPGSRKTRGSGSMDDGGGGTGGGGDTGGEGRPKRTRRD